jgi:rubrerythrin
MIDALQRCREAEKEQALFYRSLAFLAEEAGDAALCERLHALHADEQHHLSRISARLLELGAAPVGVHHIRAQRASLQDWETHAREREREEIGRYQELLGEELDDATADLIREILGTEQHHVRELGGKWTPA